MQLFVPGCPKINLLLRPSKRRKSIALKVDFAQLLVYFPEQCELSLVQDFLIAKKDWIIKKYQFDNYRLQLKQDNKVLINGCSYNLQLVVATRNLVTKLSGVIRVEAVTKVKFKQVFLRWLRQETLHLVTARVNYFADLMDLKPNNIKVKKYKARWGCCFVDGSLAFNVVLGMAPNFVVDAVVVHELAHLLYKDHSRHFWACVLSYYPQYKYADNWLKENKYLLQGDLWS